MVTKIEEPILTSAEMPPIETRKPPKIDQIKHYRSDRDGTYYQILALHLPNGIQCGYMDQTNPCWLIIEAFNKTAYAFPDKGYLHRDYILEKLCKNNSYKDAENILELINHARGTKQ